MKHTQRGTLEPTSWGILIVGLRCANPSPENGILMTGSARRHARPLPGGTS